MASHRGPHPEDDEQFSSSQVPRLRAAVHDLSWLRTRGYGDSAALKIVGDRYRLRRRQRNAVARSWCTDAQAAHRRTRRRSRSNLAGRWIEVDGFNVVITLEGALGGAYLFVGRDGAYRDVDPVKGTYRIVEETRPAVRAIRRAVRSIGVAGLTWRLDAHVSNVGRLVEHLTDLSPSDLGWTVRVQENVDETLIRRSNPVATSDSEIFDQIDEWCSLEAIVLPHLRVEPEIRDLRPRGTGWAVD